MNELVDLTVFSGWTIFFHVIKALVTFNVSRAILKDKYSPLVSFLVTFSGLMLVSFVSVSTSKLIPFELFEIVEVAGLLVYIIVLVGSVLFLYDNKTTTKLISAVFGAIAFPLFSALIKVFVISFIPEWEDFLFDYQIPAYFVIASSTTGFFFSFVYVLILKILNAKRNVAVSYKTKYCWFYFFPVTHWVTNVFFQVLTKHITDSEFASMLHTAVAAIYIALLVIDFALIFFIDHFEKIEIENVQHEVTKTKNELDYSQIELLKEEKQNFRKIKHDYLNFLTVAQGLIEIDQKEKALELLKDTTNELMNVSNIPLCSDETVNTALFIKQKQASQKGITIDIEIEENHKFKTSDYDISRILFNLLDNAIEAVNETNNTEKIISLKILSNENSLKIICENPCPDKKSYRSPERGNGIKIIKDIVKKYKGNFDFNIINDQNLKNAIIKIEM